MRVRGRGGAYLPSCDDPHENDGNERQAVPAHTGRGVRAALVEPALAASPRLVRRNMKRRIS